MGKSTISMVIFNSYFDITRGYPMSRNDLTHLLPRRVDHVTESEQTPGDHLSPSSERAFLHHQQENGLVFWEIYRKTPYLMGNSMNVSMD
jgi:hypothetical protein